MELRFEPSEMERFGLRIARLTIDTRTTPPPVDDILELCADQKVEMLTLRVVTGSISLVQSLEAAKFRLMDCLIYYEAKPDGPFATRPGIRPAGSADAEQIGRVARACFRDYISHYHADPRLDRELIAEGYADWATRSCNAAGIDDAVFVYEANSRIAGFATLRQNGPADVEGLLFAVHPDFSGQGIHGALIERGLEWCAESGRTRMIISTQLPNIRVQRSYCNRGFRPFESYFTLHKWFI